MGIECVKSPCVNVASENSAHLEVTDFVMQPTMADAVLPTGNCICTADSIYNSAKRYGPYGYVCQEDLMQEDLMQVQIDGLIQAIRERKLRDDAIDALVQIGPDAVPALIEGLKDQNDHVQRGVVHALGDIGPAAVPALIEALKDHDDDVRWNAAYALGDIGPDAKAAIPALIEALKDHDDDVQRGAAYALGNIGSAAVPALIEGFKGPGRMRRGAAEAFRYTGPAAVPALIEALKDQDKSVRRWAALALTKVYPLD